MVLWAEGTGKARDLTRLVVAALNGEVASGPTKVNPPSIPS